MFTSSVKNNEKPRAKQRILLIQDSDNFTVDLENSLSSASYTICKPSIRNHTKLDQQNYDLILLDEHSTIFSNDISVPILYMCNGFNDDRIFDYDDFILKPVTPEELLLRIEKLIKKQHKCENIETEQITHSCYIDGNARLVYIDKQPKHLTPKEYTLFELLYVNNGQIISIKQIIEKLWPANNNATAKDVQQYIYSLRKKIEPDVSNPCIIQNQPGFGYKLVAYIQYKESA